ncbi:MAG TPA: ammonium transporter [Streptosporangiaceae bacterium]
MHISAGDTAWMLTSTALVLFMMPGLALFYGGLVGAKNVIATMVQSFVAIGIISLLWAIIGYSLTFGSDHGGVIGSLQYFMLDGVNGKPISYAPTIPALVYMAFQMKFAVITPALIAGAFCERMRFRGYLVFIRLWSLVVYCPFAHAEWGGGFLGTGGLHAIDFAGGSVVHELAGAAALATAFYLKRSHQLERPHNVPLVLLGAGILWFGWFGFNAGSANSAGTVAGFALVNTQLGACAGMIVWMAVEWWRRGKPSGVGIASGAVAGLAAITPAAGYVPPWAAIVIGAAAGLLCYGAVHLKEIFHYDDSLDVVGVHMVGGAVGVVLTGVFASLAVNAAGEAGGWTQLGRQLVLAVIGIAYPFVVTWLLLWVIDHTVGLRVSPGDEAEGLDLSEYHEVAYEHLDGGEVPAAAGAAAATGAVRGDGAAG